MKTKTPKPSKTATIINQAKALAANGVDMPKLNATSWHTGCHQNETDLQGDSVIKVHDGGLSLPPYGIGPKGMSKADILIYLAGLKAIAKAGQFHVIYQDQKVCQEYLDLLATIT